MRKISVLIITLCLLYMTGCNLLESALTDLGGWNLSACVDGYQTCWNLFWDNSSQIVGGSNIIDDVLAPYAK